MFWTNHFLMKINTIFFVKIPKIFIAKIPKNCVVKMSDWNYHFYWFCYTFEIVILCIKNPFSRSQTFFYCFCYIFEIVILHWKSRKNNQLIFVGIIFPKKINTKCSIEFTVHFELAILYWKPIQTFLLKINWFLSASFS